jgi:hypothetical protein
MPNPLALIPPKDPTATLDYAFNWTAWLQSGETISTAVVTVPAGITLSTLAAINGGIVTFWLSGGTLDQVYEIACTITTSQGRTDSRSFPLTIFMR